MYCETPEQKAKRRERDRNRAAKKRANYTPEEKKMAQAEHSAYQKRRRMEMTIEERRALRRKLYRKYHDDRYRAKAAAYMRSKRASDFNFAMAERLRARVKKAIKNAGGNKADGTFELTGCTSEQLCKWLECQFTDGMAWSNRSQWHIDHIIPCSAFNLRDPQQQLVAFHYSNLRPVWGTVNLQKSDTVPATQLKIVWTLEDVVKARSEISRREAMAAMHTSPPQL